MLILLNNKKEVINLNCVSEIQIRKDKKAERYFLECTMICSANGIHQRILGRFDKEEYAANVLEDIVNQYGRGQKIYKMGEKKKWP